MKIFGGIIPGPGELRIAGQPAALANAQDAREKGVLHPPGAEPLRQPGRGSQHLSGPRTASTRTQDFRRNAGAAPNPQGPGCGSGSALACSRLSTAQQQLVEIAKAMSFKSRVVIMDEPTASLTKREIDTLFHLIRRMRADGMGSSTSHTASRKFWPSAIASRCCETVAGSVPLPIQEFKWDSVIWMMAGRSVEEMYPRAHTVHPERVLEVQGLRLAPAHSAHRSHRATGRGGGPRRPRR